MACGKHPAYINISRMFFNNYINAFLNYLKKFKFFALFDIIEPILLMLIISILKFYMLKDYRIINILFRLNVKGIRI